MSSLARQMRRRRVPAKQRKYLRRSVLLDGRPVAAEDIGLFHASFDLATLLDAGPHDVWMTYKGELLAPGQTVVLRAGRMFEQPFPPVPEWLLEALPKPRPIMSHNGT